MTLVGVKPSPPKQYTPGPVDSAAGAPAFFCPFTMCFDLTLLLDNETAALDHFLRDALALAGAAHEHATEPHAREGHRGAVRAGRALLALRPTLPLRPTPPLSACRQLARREVQGKQRTVPHL
jgi:hypothetical protein